jgi:hypothetical protein
VEVQRLSHGKVLTHFCELCGETQASLTITEQKYTKVLADTDRVDKLAYWSHILNNLNEYTNKIQQDATVCRYLFTAKLLYMFRVSSHPSSGVHTTVTAASGTGYVTYQGNNLLPP